MEQILVLPVLGGNEGLTQDAHLWCGSVMWVPSQPPVAVWLHQGGWFFFFPVSPTHGQGGFPESIKRFQMSHFASWLCRRASSSVWGCRAPWQVFEG